MSFHFHTENIKKAEEIKKKYPSSRSALIPLLDLAQRQNNRYLSKEVIVYISEYLNIPYAKVMEVATFYSLFNLKPVGKYHIQLCGSTPCWLRSSQNIKEAITEELGIDYNQTTQDKKFTLTEVECLGACINAPVAQINDEYYENLDKIKIQDIIKKLQNS